MKRADRKERIMRSATRLLLGLAVAIILSGCVVVPAHRGPVVVVHPYHAYWR
jgi:hypothetical protein